MKDIDDLDPLLLELGEKLASFRRRLAHSIGLRKITQAVFGAMYGDFSGRTIETYENGKVSPPGWLLFRLWKEGHSIDAIFRGDEISQSGAQRAKILYEECELKPPPKNKHVA